jgi:murein DD-endopeptidase MepM/ murein hydrolase activator NlpD
LEISWILKKQVWISLFLAWLLLWPLAGAQAQEQEPEGPVYIVQTGDTLWGIAQRFGVSMDELARVNGISEPSQLAVGARLVIPGLEGIQGVLVTTSVPFGEDLESLGYRYQVPRDTLARLNKVTHPEEIYAGSALIIPEDGSEAETPLLERATLKPGLSLMEVAISHGVSPWTLVMENQLPGSWAPLPGDNLYLAGEGGSGPGALPAALTEASAGPLPLVQGRTLVVELAAPPGASLNGRFLDQELHFFPTAEGSYVALQGIHAMLDPGAYPLSLDGVLADGTPLRFSQRVYVQDGNYPFDPPLVVNSETVDVDNTTPEDLQWFDAVDAFTAERYWDGLFQAPVMAQFVDCYPSKFGHRRSYNGSAYEFFHTGLDFCGQTGHEIYAPAPGRVVFVGELTVRGNATVIDHGWGVYSAYAHQSEIFVAEGDWVETGQTIGSVGETGRVTGPHLHWEIIVGGVQVDPLQWLGQAFP